MNTEFAVDKGGDRGNPPAPGGNQSSDTFRLPPDAMPDQQPAPANGDASAVSGVGAADVHTTASLGGATEGEAHPREGEPSASKPPTDSHAAIEPDARASGQETGKSHDL